MIAMVFAAGLGTRLKPFTLNHPKALVPVWGVPMLQLVILRLKDAGINRIVVNVHHFANQITEFLSANDNFGCDIVISDESDNLLDTGGGILKAARWLDGSSPILVHNADILTDIDFDRMFASHLRTQADATLLVSDRQTSRYLLFDRDGLMRGWTNVSDGRVRPASLDTTDLSHLAFGGIHIISPPVLAQLRSYRQPNTPFSITDFYIDSCSSLSIKAYQPTTSYLWHDIGKPESLARAQAAISAKTDFFTKFAIITKNV